MIKCVLCAGRKRQKVFTWKTTDATENTEPIGTKRTGAAGQSGGSDPPVQWCAVTVKLRGIRLDLWRCCHFGYVCI